MQAQEPSSLIVVERFFFFCNVPQQSILTVVGSLKPTLYEEDPPLVEPISSEVPSVTSREQKNGNYLCYLILP